MSPVGGTRDIYHICVTMETDGEPHAYPAQRAIGCTWLGLAGFGLASSLTGFDTQIPRSYVDLISSHLILSLQPISITGHIGKNHPIPV